MRVSISSPWGQPVSRASDDPLSKPKIVAQMEVCGQFERRKYSTMTAIAMTADLFSEVARTTKVG